MLKLVSAQTQKMVLKLFELGLEAAYSRGKTQPKDVDNDAGTHSKMENNTVGPIIVLKESLLWSK